MIEVYFSRRARKKLDDILDHLETEWSQKEVEAFISKLTRALALISSQPDCCPVSKKKKGIHKCVLTPQTSLYYRVKKREIEVIALFDNRQDPADLKF